MTTTSHLSLTDCKMHLDFRGAKMQALELVKYCILIFHKLNAFKDVVGLLPISEAFHLNIFLKIIF